MLQSSDQVNTGRLLMPYTHGILLMWATLREIRPFAFRRILSLSSISFILHEYGGEGLQYRLMTNADKRIQLVFLVNSSVEIYPVPGLGEVSNGDFTAIQLFLNLANTASVGWRRQNMFGSTKLCLRHPVKVICCLMERSTASGKIQCIQLKRGSPVRTNSTGILLHEFADV